MTPILLEERHADRQSHLTICLRGLGVPGDPTYHAFQNAVTSGALPFTCQGSENGLTIEGGKTLGWEIVSATLRGAQCRAGLWGLIDSQARHEANIPIPVS